MRLQKLTLDNFQGIRHLALAFDGHSASIYGDNATGKTTIFNALTWLLFDKPSTGAKGFTPKTQDTHNLDHSAQGVFRLEDGQLMTLQKTYHEVYRKRRGAAGEEFAGHTTDYYVDGVPTKEKDYTDTLLRLCGSAERMKLLTMPDYFAETLPWEQRRQILLDICGDVSMENVIAGEVQLQVIGDFLRKPGTKDQYYDVDEYRKIAMGKRKEINRQLDEIPSRIDEVQRGMPDVTDLNLDTINTELRRLKEQQETLEEQKRQAMVDGGTTEVAQAIAAVRTQLAEAKAAHMQAMDAASQKQYEQADKLRTRLSGLQEDIQRNKDIIRINKNVAEVAEQDCDRLREEFYKLQDAVFDASTEICPTCGQRLPEERIEQIHRDFQERQANRMEEIRHDGKAAKARGEEAVQRIKETETMLVTQAGLEADLKDKIQRLQTTPEPFENTDTYRTLTEKLAGLDAKKRDGQAAKQEIVKRYEERIEALIQQADIQSEHKLRLAVAQQHRKRILSLEGREKDLAGELENTERGLYLCDLFTKTKVEMLTSKINDRFQDVRFQLFQDQINGGVKEGCEVLVPSADGTLVPYADANNAGRMNAGLEIIGTLSRYWGLEMPVVVDNAEAITRLRKIPAQVIRLVVSEADKSLRLQLQEGK